MKLSYSATWNDTVQMLRANSSLLLAIAGAFFFLPAVLVGYLLPQPAGAQTVTQMLADMRAYFSDNWHWLLLSNLINMIGAIAIYLLLLQPRGRTVGGAIGGALPLLPSFFILTILVYLVVGFGLFWFLLPGIYLLGRLGTSGAVMVGEDRKNPFSAIGGSWRLTKSNGWAIAGLIVIVFVAGYLLMFAVTAVLGSIFLLIGGREGVGGLLVAILGAALTAILLTVIYALFAAIYRALSAPAPAAATSGI